MAAQFSGLTWDHPRGYRALDAAAVRAPGLIEWSRQRLEGFESHPIPELAARHELLVIDHPHIGEVAREDCIQPLETLFSPEEIAAWGKQSIGAGMRSYFWQGAHYALPLDIAMQAMARDPDNIRDPADSWDDVLRLSEVHPTALSLAGPHALITFYSLCLSLGEEPGSAGLISDHAGFAALDTMRRIVARQPKGSEALNPIGLLEAVSSRSGIALVPLVFGYVNYAARPAGSTVSFSEAPRITAGGRRGSVLGGTGIAIVKRARPDAALLDHLRRLMSGDAQARFIPAHDGQPSARSAWQDDTVNVASGDFYRATIETAESAWVRPRFDGYIAFQNRASAVIRDGLMSGIANGDILNSVRRLWLSAYHPISLQGPLS